MERAQPYSLHPQSNILFSILHGAKFEYFTEVCKYLLINRPGSDLRWCNILGTNCKFVECKASLKSCKIEMSTSCFVNLYTLYTVYVHRKTLLMTAVVFVGQSLDILCWILLIQITWSRYSLWALLIWESLFYLFISVWWYDYYAGY